LSIFRNLLSKPSFLEFSQLLSLQQRLLQQGCSKGSLDSKQPFLL